MDENQCSPPKTDYHDKQELLSALRKLTRQMEAHTEEYRARQKLTDDIRIVENRKPSVATVLLLTIVLRTAFSDFDSVLHIAAFDEMPFRRNLMITGMMLIGIPLIYYVISKLMISAKLSRYKRKLSECEAGLKTIYNSYGTSPVSFRYAMPDTVSTIKQMIEDGRADTVKEAINFYLDDDHNEKLLDYQHQIAKSGKQTAIATSITAFFAWRNAKWSKRNYRKKP